MKTEKEIRDHLLEKAEADSAFRAQLVADPKAAVEREFSVTVPDGMSLHVHEETATSVHLVLPPADGKLRPEEMHLAVGGHGPDGQGGQGHGGERW